MMTGRAISGRKSYWKRYWKKNRHYELLSYKQGNYEECLRYLELSESALREEEFRMPWQQLWIRHDRGVILAKMGKQEAADNSLEQAGEFLSKA